MKRIFLLIIVSFFVLNVQAQRPEKSMGQPSKGNPSAAKETPLLSKHYFKSACREMNLKGKVKSISEIQYNAVKQNQEIVPIGSGTSSTVTIFDVAGNKISQTEKAEGENSTTFEYKYSKPGMVTEQYFYSNGNKQFTERQIFEYNENDYQTRLNDYDSLGMLDSRITYKNAINYRENIYTSFQDSLYYLDWDTHLLTPSYSGDYIEYTFDADTNVVKRKSNFLGTSSIITSGYNKLNQKISEIYQSNSSHNGQAVYDTIYTLKFQYDANGNVTKETATGDSYSRNFQYTYDANGNWTKKIMENIDPEGKVDYLIIERKILYF